MNYVVILYTKTKPVQLSCISGHVVAFESYTADNVMNKLCGAIVSTLVVIDDDVNAQAINYVKSRMRAPR